MTAQQTGVEVRRRVAAIVALVTAAALVVLVIALFLRHGAYLLLGVFGVGLTVAGAWWAVTERMPRRVYGVLGLIVGIAVLGVSVVKALVDTDRVVTWIVVLAVLVAVATVCARAAMVHRLHHPEVRVHEGGPPRRAVLLCNPASGGGKVEQFGLTELARELGVEAVVLDPESDLERLARDAVARGADCLGMAGGDGSQALVASIAVEHGLPFVCVSAGTRNHFALDLGLVRTDPRASMYAFRDAIERRVDYATVNGRLFVNNVSLGVYAELVQQDSYRDAKLETAKTLLPELLGRQAQPFDLQFTTPEGEEVDGAIVLMVSNNPYVITMKADMGVRHRLDSGDLGVFAVTTRTGAEAGRLFAATALGERTKSRYWRQFTTKNFEVSSRSGSAFAGIDGEALDMATPLRFEIHPRGLTLLVPAGNLEAAERRRARDVGLQDLIAVAVGRDPAKRS